MRATLSIFICINSLYFFGFFDWLSSLVPLNYLAALPGLVVLTAVLTWFVEEQLAKPKLNPAGRAVLVTGCDTGFGHALAKRLAAEGFVTDGYQVFAGCLNASGSGAESLRGLTGIEVLAVDVTIDEAVEQMVADVERRLSDLGLELWAVVANAGVADCCPFEWCLQEDFERIFNVNLYGTIRTVRKTLPLIRRSKGRVIVSASLGANVSCPSIIPYCMTKAACKSLAEGLHRELAPFGVHCISIEPGFFRTPLVQQEPAFEKRFPTLPQTTQDAYESMLDSLKAQEKLVRTTASPRINLVIEVFLQAITSTRPRRTYIAVEPLSLPAILLLLYLPVRFGDALLNMSCRADSIRKLNRLFPSQGSSSAEQLN